MQSKHYSRSTRLLCKAVPRSGGIACGTPDGRWLITGGRDSVVLLWDLLGGNSGSATSKGEKHGKLSPRLERTIPILERVEAAGWIKCDGGLQFFTAGEKGVVKVWDGRVGTFLYALNKVIEGDSEQQQEILDAW